VADFAEKQAINLEERFEDKLPKVYKDVGETFSMKKILNTERQFVPPELIPHFNDAKASGYLCSELTEEDIVSQYSAFTAGI